MDCPYCSGTVPDHALACRHCGTNLHLIAPLLRRLATLEERVGALAPSKIPVADPAEPAGSATIEPAVPSPPSSPAWPQALSKTDWA